MAKALTELNLNHLSNLEAGQLIKSNLKDIGTVPAGEITDVIIKNFIISLGNKEVDYDKALVQVQKNDETAKLEVSDAKRDLSIAAFATAIHLGKLSDVPAEVEAAISLHTLFKTYDNLAKLNYEAESNGIDNMCIPVFLGCGRKRRALTWRARPSRPSRPAKFMATLVRQRKVAHRN